MEEEGEGSTGVDRSTEGLESREKKHTSCFSAHPVLTLQ